MTVLVEGYSVICQLESLERSYAGGVQAYENSVPNKTYCKDAYLCRVGFAHASDVRAWLKQCESAGLKTDDGHSWVDVAVVVQGAGLSWECPWLTLETDEFGTMWAGLSSEDKQPPAAPIWWRPGGATMLHPKALTMKSQRSEAGNLKTVYVPDPLFEGHRRKTPWWKRWL